MFTFDFLIFKFRSNQNLHCAIPNCISYTYSALIVSLTYRIDVGCNENIKIIAVVDLTVSRAVMKNIRVRSIKILTDWQVDYNISTQIICLF